MRSRFIRRRKAGGRLKPIARSLRGPFQKALGGASYREAARPRWNAPNKRYIGVPSWAQPPGGLSRRGRREGVASHPLADRRRPRANLRPRAVPARVLRVRDRLPSGPTRLHRDLHAGVLRWVGLVLLGPGAVFLVPNGEGPRPGHDAQLSRFLPEPAAAAVPLLLAPRRPAV